jgi:hypothetical protein
VEAVFGDIQCRFQVSTNSSVKPSSATSSARACSTDPRFKLEPDEAAALLSIEASSLQEFAVGVERFLTQRKAAPAPAAAQPRWSVLVVSGASHRPS